MPEEDDDKVISLNARLQAKAAKGDSSAMVSAIVRRLARAIREMREDGAASAEIARLLREAADELDRSRA